MSEIIADMVQGAPFHQFLRLVLEEVNEAEGKVAISLAVRPEVSRSASKTELHGGAIATLIDVAGDCAVALRAGGGVPTVSLTVDYLRMVRGKSVTATATLLKYGRRIAVADIAVTDGDGTLVAVGRGTYASAPG